MTNSRALTAWFSQGATILTRSYQSRPDFRVQSRPASKKIPNFEPTKTSVMRLIKYFYQLGFLLVLGLSTLQLSAQPEALTIAVSWERSTESHLYGKWLSEANPNIRTIVLYDFEVEDLPAILDSCDALLLTGGHDIYPGLYGHEADTARCGSFNLRRDALEMAALSLALESKMPVFGICRGMQLINVHQGGSLYIDLADDTNSGDLHRIGEDGWTQHLIFPEKTVFPLTEFSQSTQLVASNHHQGINRLAKSLLVVARTEDGLPEAVIFKSLEQGFLFAVQWHPEWKPLAGEMSIPLAALFLEAALEFQQSR